LFTRFFSYVPSTKVLVNAGYLIDDNADVESTNDELDSSETLPPFNDPSHNVCLEEPETTQNVCIVEQEKRHKKMPFLPSDFKLTERFSIPADCVSEIFENAKKLLDETGAVRTAASSDSRTRSVKNGNLVHPLIDSPAPKNRNLLICSCQNHHLFDFCQHSLAASADNNICFEYMTEVVKKFELKKKNKKPMASLTNALNSTLTINQKGKKKE